MADSAHPRRRRRSLLAAAGVAVALLGVLAVTQASGDGCKAVAYGAYGTDKRPPACWRPYRAASPFNAPLPEQPRLHPRSRTIVRALNRRGAPAPLRAGHHDTREDFFKAVFHARRGDPVARVRCLRASWGRCPIEGRRIRVPRGARPAAGGDGHLTIVDEESGWEYDLWQARPVRGGVLRASWGGRTRIDGSGIGSDAVAARFGSLAGLVRAEELEAGRVNHALFITIPCAGSERHVAPARKGAAPCPVPRGEPVMGARLQLAMTDEEIDALGAPPWKAALLRAMARYGLIVGDTGGPPGWALQLQSDTSYTAVGDSPRLEAFARAAGWTPFDDPVVGRTVLLGDLASGVDWSRLRVVHPCVSKGTC